MTKSLHLADLTLFLKYFRLSVRGNSSSKKRGQTLSRSYGRCIAEFLNQDSLVRLGLLDLSTCDGFGTGGIFHNLTNFSGQNGLADSLRARKLTTRTPDSTEV